MVDSLGRSFGEVTQRYVNGGTISSRPALVSLKHVRNILVKSGVTTIQINDPNQDYGVYESIAQLQNILGIPIGDGSGVTGGGVTNDTLYIVNDGGVSPPDTFLIDLASLADGNGIYDGSGTVPDGTVAAIDSGIVFQGLQPTTFFDINMDQGLYGSTFEMDDDRIKYRFYDLATDAFVLVDANGVEIRADGPDRVTITGAARVTDLVTDPPTKLVGADVDGDLSQVILGTNLSFSNDTLNATGGGGITGTGLTNRLAYWTASGAIGYESTLLVDSTNNRLKIGNQVAPVRTLDVTGEARVSDLTTDTPTRLVGADADGDLNEAGSGLANRLAYWTGTGAIGYSSKFRADTTNGRIGINAAAAPVTPLDMGNTLGQRISLYANGNDRSGFAIGGGTIQYYVSNSLAQNNHSFGTLSTSDGTTYTEGLRLSTLDGSITRLMSVSQNMRIGRLSGPYIDVGTTIGDALGFNLASARHITGDLVNFSFSSNAANEAWFAVGNNAGTIRGFGATITATGTTEIAALSFAGVMVTCGESEASKASP